MHENQFKKPQKDSSSDSDPQSDDQAIFGDDRSQTIKITREQLSPQLQSQQQKPTCMVFVVSGPNEPFIDNQRQSESQKNSSMSSKNRPVIYDEVQRYEDNELHGRQRNHKQDGYQQPYNQRNNNNYQHYGKRHDEHRQYRGQEIDQRSKYDADRRKNHNRNRQREYENDQRSRNNHYQQNQRYESNNNFRWDRNQRNHREQFNFDSHSRNCNQYQQKEHQNYRNDRNNRLFQKNWNWEPVNRTEKKQNYRNYPQNNQQQQYQREQQQQYNKRQNDNDYHERHQNNHQMDTYRHQNRNNREFKRQNSRNYNFQTRNSNRSNSKSKHNFKPVRNNLHQRQNSHSSSKYNLSKRNKSNQSRFKQVKKNPTVKQRANQPEIKPKNQIKKQEFHQQKDTKKLQEYQASEQPILNHRISSNKQKIEQPPTKLEHKQSSKSAQSNQNNSTSLNRAHSNITVENSSILPAQNNKKLQESSIWQPSDDEQNQNDSKSWSKSQKSLQKSSFQCHEISLEYPRLPPVINRNEHNMFSFTEDFSLLQALDNPNLDLTQNLSKNDNISSNILDPIPKKEQKPVSQVKQPQPQSDSLFTLRQLKILEKMFDSIPLQEQSVFVQIRAKTQNISHYKIKNLSSQLYHIECTAPQKLKDNNFISIKEFEKSVPRDAQPFGRNRPVNQKIQLKTSKIVLAQIKNPLQLLSHKKDLLQKFQSFEERQVIKKIQTNQKQIKKAATIINIEEVTLKCSSCTGKKSFLWNDQIISHQCKAQCANFLRFNIDSISIC